MFYLFCCIQKLSFDVLPVLLYSKTFVWCFTCFVVFKNFRLMFYLFCCIQKLSSQARIWDLKFVLFFSKFSECRFSMLRSDGIENCNCKEWNFPPTPHFFLRNVKPAKHYYVTILQRCLDSADFELLS
jgi:hypothetical protein